MGTTVIAMDPSLSAFGVAVIDIDKNELIYGKCIESKAASDLNTELEPFVRIRELVTPILCIIDDYHCVGLIAEIPYFGKDHKSMMMAGRMQGLVCSIPPVIEITRSGMYFPAVGVLPQHIKQIAEGMPGPMVNEVAVRLNVGRNPNKHKIIAVIADIYPNIYDIGDNTAFRVEAIADACGAWLAGQREFRYLYSLEALPNYRAQLKKRRRPTQKQGKLL